jgi:hypothetical protein
VKIAPDTVWAWMAEVQVRKIRPRRRKTNLRSVFFMLLLFTSREV